MSDTLREQLLQLAISRISAWTEFCINRGDHDTDTIVGPDDSSGPVYLKSQREVGFSMEFREHPGLSVHTNTVVISKSYAFGPLVAGITWEEGNGLSPAMVDSVRRALDIEPGDWLNLLGWCSGSERIEKKDILEADPSKITPGVLELMKGVAEYCGLLRTAPHPTLQSYGEFFAQKAKEWVRLKRSSDGLPTNTSYTPFYNLLDVSRCYEQLSKKGQYRGYMMDNP